MTQPDQTPSFTPAASVCAGRPPLSACTCSGMGQPHPCPHHDWRPESGAQAEWREMVEAPSQPGAESVAQIAIREAEKYRIGVYLNLRWDQDSSLQEMLVERMKEAITAALTTERELRAAAERERDEALAIAEPWRGECESWLDALRGNAALLGQLLDALEPHRAPTESYPEAMARVLSAKLEQAARIAELEVARAKEDELVKRMIETFGIGHLFTPENNNMAGMMVIGETITGKIATLEREKAALVDNRNWLLAQQTKHLAQLAEAEAGREAMRGALEKCAIPLAAWKLTDETETYLELGPDMRKALLDAHDAAWAELEKASETRRALEGEK